MKYIYVIAYFVFILVMISSCDDTIERPTGPYISTQNNNANSGNTNAGVEGIDYFLPQINLNNWKVTLPIGNPTEVHPPEILNYAINETLRPFFYNDSTDGSLVFYTYPGASTTNSSISNTNILVCVRLRKEIIKNIKKKSQYHHRQELFS